MDALLPSEIARLVLGYLQEQKCEEAAKIFIETSPLLQECRIVSRRGGRYSTKVGGLSLIDILDKYCATNALIQEKLQKISDSEQLKQCSDILEQLRFLLEGSRGHRFVVNINVPSQNSPNGPFGTPNASSSTRKRHHSHHERGKRAAKSLNSLIEKSSQNAISQNCDTFDAMPLESLPDHTLTTEQTGVEYTNVCSNKLPSITNVNSLNDNRVSVFASTNVNSDGNLEVTSSNTVNSSCKDQSTETVHVNDMAGNINKCTAGTNTDEIMNYCTAEVQTGTSDIVESESDVNDEPIQNLSILTKELMNRTELQERIAENINRAILPIESSFREDATDIHSTDLNKSKLSDYDNIIKSAVKATETDLEGFLHEFFSVGDTDLISKKDSDNSPIISDLLHNGNHLPMEVDHELTGSIELNLDNHEEQLSGSEVPLKQRLRSSSRCQITSNDEEGKDNEILLENQNAEAVMNIVNVIAKKRNSLTDSEQNFEEQPVENNLENPKQDAIVIQALSTETEAQNNESNSKTTKSTRKVKRKARSRAGNNDRDTAKKSKAEESKKLEEVMPTLILCSEKEVESLLPNTLENFIPIAPRPGEPSSPPPPTSASKPTIYLRTVNVPRQFVKPEQIELSNTLLQKTLQQFQTKTSDDPTIEKIVSKNDLPMIADTSVTESITLYGGEESNNPEVTTVSSIADMPIINIDGTLITGSGLSPFLKGALNVGTDSPQVIVLSDENKDEEEETNHQSTELETCPVKVKEAEMNNQVALTTEVQPMEKSEVRLAVDEVITKHTPNTLLRSRAKNNRLSLSTPRRRNSHVRVLDFSTPAKPSSEKVVQSCVKSSVCRSGLFKSPIYEGSPSVDAADDNLPAAKKVFVVPDDSESESHVPEAHVSIVKKVRTLSPQSALLQVPIATRSPAPKLRGNWNKIAGIGLILGETSESSPDKSMECCSTPPTPVPSKPIEKVLEKSWDSDLRKIVGSPLVEEESNLGSSKKKGESKNATPKVKTKPMVDESEKVVKTDLEKSGNNGKNNLKKESNESDDSKKENKKVDVLKLKCEKTDVVQKSHAENDVQNKSKIPNKPEKDLSVNNKVKEVLSAKKDAEKESNTENNEKQQNKSVESKSAVTSPSKLQIPVQQKKRITPPSLKKINPRVSFDDHVLINKTHITRNSLESLCIASTLLDLETPRKIEMDICVPPTPQVFATPADKLVKFDRAKSNSEISIKDCVDTPEFPITPCIVFTPKFVEESAQKRPSPYYEPSEEVKIKEVINAEKIRVQETTTTIVVKKSIVELQEHKAIEITRFGVVDSTEKDSQDSSAESSSKDTSHDTSKDTSRESVENESTVDDNVSTNTGSDSEDDSSNSSSSSSSSSSSDTSSSSSSSSSAASSPTKSITNNQEMQSSIKACEIDTPEKLLADFSKISQEDIDNIEAKVNLKSPTKVFPVLKDRSDEPVKETPVKEDEVVIFETPSVSETERALRRDSITNLNSNISAAIGTSTQNKNNSSICPQTNSSELSKGVNSELTAEDIPNKPTTSSKVRITKIEKIAATDGMAIQVSKLLQSGTNRTSISTIQQQANINTDAKLSHELEEKRLRVMAKFKGSSNGKPATQTKKLTDDSKQKKAQLTIKKTVEEKASSEIVDSLQQSKGKKLETPPSAVEVKFVDKNEGKEMVSKKDDKIVTKKEVKVVSKEEKVVNKKEEKIINKKGEKANKKEEKVANNKEDKIIVTRSAKIVNKNDEKNAEVKKVKGWSSPRKKTEQNLDKNAMTESNITVAKFKKEAIQSVAKEEVVSAATAIPVENSKGISKAKVDQVKRDLFSDEENSDQRTTRSQASRRTSTTTTLPNPKCSDENANANIPKVDAEKEKLPGKLLECLQLIPANKVDAETDDLCSNLSDNVHCLDTSNVGLISVVYDESVPIKKRKRNYSSSELQNEYIFQFPGETHVLNVTPLQEIFKLDPKTKTKKKISTPKKSPLKEKKSKTSKNVEPPLANSSPQINPLHPKNEDEKKKKSCKRKQMSPVKDEKVDNKPKVDPQTLFKKIKIDEFLKSVQYLKN